MSDKNVPFDFLTVNDESYGSSVIDVWEYEGVDDRTFSVDPKDWNRLKELPGDWGIVMTCAKRDITFVDDTVEGALKEFGEDCPFFREDIGREGREFVVWSHYKDHEEDIGV